MNDCQGMFVIRWVLSAAIVITGLAIYEEQRHKQINNNHKTLESVVINEIQKVADIERKIEETTERIQRIENAMSLTCE